MFWFLILVGGYKLLTCRLFYRAYLYREQVATLAPQVDAIRKANAGNWQTTQQQINPLYRSHGINHMDGCLMGLADVAFFLIALTCFAPSNALSGVSFFWVSDITHYSGTMPIIWMLATVAHNYAIQTQKRHQQNQQQIIAGALLLLGIVSGVAWYWQWPAYIFVFWILIAVCNLFGNLWIRSARWLAAVTPPTSQPTPPPSGPGSTVQQPSPQPPAPPTRTSPKTTHQHQPAAPAPHRTSGRPTPSRQPGRAGPTRQPTLASPPSPNDRPGSSSSPLPPPMPRSIDLQKEVDGTATGQILRLNPPAQHLEGPVEIRQSLTIEGQGATVWAQKGPVITIKADGVTIRNLNVEITDRNEIADPILATALLVEPGRRVTLENVAVRGYAEGIESEPGPWRYPRSLSLASLKSSQQHEFRLRISAGVPLDLISEIAGVSFSPHRIPAGPSEVCLIIGSLSEGTRLRGRLVLRSSQLDRQIELTANARRGAPHIGAGQVVYQPVDWSQLSTPAPQSGATASEDTDKITKESHSAGSPTGDTQPIAENDAGDDSTVKSKQTDKPNKQDQDAEKSGERKIVRPGEMGAVFAEENGS